MALIQVYYRDLLKDEVELQQGVTTIGRSMDSDIKIDNAGVSAHHAKIIHDGNEFIIEDSDSRNGTFVNGMRVSRKVLSDGDEVIISKHILKLAANAGNLIPPEKQEQENQNVVQGATIEVNVSNLGEMVRQRQAQYGAYLLLTGVVQRRAKYPLNKLNFKFGKVRDADIYTPGWFAPKIAARVVCKNDGFYIVPSSRGHVKVNGMKVEAPMKLEDGDGLSVRGINLMFYRQNENEDKQ
jgi:pSer/pThr/pTyr-binding forkhead associated (FHA) protein